MNAAAATDGPSELDGGSRAVSGDFPRDSPHPVPRHVAIIMDGNGRWAQSRGLPRVAGHRAGAEALRKTLRAAVKQGIEVLTIYAFSSENWKRSPDEVSDLTGLMRFYLDRELTELHREGVCLKLIGDYAQFGARHAHQLERAVELTKDNCTLTLVVALNYGSRAELTAATRAIAHKVAEGEIALDSIDEATIEYELETRGLPPLDLLIRTSGEVRLSNFLLWQAAYAELVFTDVLWPDFDDHHLEASLKVFASRERRFGAR